LDQAGPFHSASESGNHITVLLARWREGDSGALGELIPLVYDNLRQIAARHLARERDGFTLCATEVVHEAYRKLLGIEIDWQDRAHFLAVASRQMRQVLVDYARTKKRQKRGGGEWQRVTLTERGSGSGGDPCDILAVEGAMERLAANDARKATVVDMIAFGGLSVQETAEALQLSESVVRRDWRMARAWLENELKTGPARAGRA